jgi:hypothetical protein
VSLGGSALGIWKMARDACINVVPMRCQCVANVLLCKPDLEDCAGRMHVGARIRENIFYTETHSIIDNELTWKMARKGCMSARGGAPSAISMTVIPSDQMSASPS